jgi:type I restriction enzyme S subunit
MSFPRYPAYKDSGVEWLGEVPEHWEVDRLKYIAKASPSNVDKKSYEDDHAVMLCNYTDVYYNEEIVAGMPFMAATATTDQVDKFTLRAGDTIITKDSETADDIAISAYVPQDLPGVVCGYHLSLIRPREGVVGRFIKRLFDSHFARATFGIAANGLTRYGLSQYPLDNFELPLPPAGEQTAITTFLDCEIAKIDALVADYRTLIELLKEKRHAVISHAVTKGLDPKVPMKDSGVEWLGEVPEHWEIIALSRVTTSRCDGPFGTAIKSEHYKEGGARVIRLQNIRAGRFDGADAAFLDLDYFKQELFDHDVIGGDLLIAGLGDENNQVGRACVAPDNLGVALVKADCFRFRLDKNFASQCH